MERGDTELLHLEKLQRTGRRSQRGGKTSKENKLWHEKSRPLCKEDNAGVGTHEILTTGFDIEPRYFKLTKSL